MGADLAPVDRERRAFSRGESRWRSLRQDRDEVLAERAVLINVALQQSRLRSSISRMATSYMSTGPFLVSRLTR